MCRVELAMFQLESWSWVVVVSCNLQVPPWKLEMGPILEVGHASSNLQLRPISNFQA